LDCGSIYFLVNSAGVSLNLHPTPGKESDVVVGNEIFKPGQTVLTVVDVDDRRVAVRGFTIKNLCDVDEWKEKMGKDQVEAKLNSGIL
jgi:hypothetical protein